MGDFNKIFAIALGVILLVVLGVFLFRRFGGNLNTSLKSPLFLREEESTPTPTPYEEIVISSEQVERSGVMPQRGGVTDSDNIVSEVDRQTLSQVKEYPETGSEGLLLVMAASALSAGVVLRRFGRR